MLDTLPVRVGTAPARDAGPATDAGQADAGLVDAGLTDGGAGDAGMGDAGGTLDGGMFDGGPPDAGNLDAGTSDAGPGVRVLTLRAGQGPIALGESLRAPPTAVGATQVVRVVLESTAAADVQSVTWQGPGWATVAPVAARMVTPESALVLSLTLAPTAAASDRGTLVVQVDGAMVSTDVVLPVGTATFVQAGAGSGRRMGTHANTSWTFVAEIDEGLNDALADRHYAVRRVAYGGGLFFTAGNAAADSGERGRLRVSADGVTWAECISRHDDDLPEYEPHLTMAEAGCTLPANLPSLEDVAFFAGRFYALWADGLLTSADGYTWTDAPSALPESPGADGVVEALTDLVVAGDRLFAFGGTRLLSTRDGEAWHAQAMASSVVDIAFATPAGTEGSASGGRFVVGLSPHDRMASDDGITWAHLAANEGSMHDRALRSVHVFGGRFHALSNGRVYRSADGIAWEETWSRGVQGGCTDPVTGTFLGMQSDYNYGINMHRQRYRRANDLWTVGAEDPPVLELHTPNRLSAQPACGYVLAPEAP